MQEPQSLWLIVVTILKTRFLLARKVKYCTRYLDRGNLPRCVRSESILDDLVCRPIVQFLTSKRCQKITKADYILLLPLPSRYECDLVMIFRAGKSPDLPRNFTCSLGQKQSDQSPSATFPMLKDLGVGRSSQWATCAIT